MQVGSRVTAGGQEYLSQLGGAFSDDPGRFYADVPLDKNPEAIFDNLSRETTIREKKQRHQQKSKSSKSRPSGVEGEEREDWQSLVRVADLLPVDDNHLLNRYQHQQPPVHHHHHIHQLHHHHHHHHPGGRGGGGGGGGTDQPVYSQHHAHQTEESQDAESGTSTQPGKRRSLSDGGYSDSSRVSASQRPPWMRSRSGRHHQLTGSGGSLSSDNIHTAGLTTDRQHGLDTSLGGVDNVENPWTGVSGYWSHGSGNVRQDFTHRGMDVTGRATRPENVYDSTVTVRDDKEHVYSEIPADFQGSIRTKSPVTTVLDPGQTLFPTSTEVSDSPTSGVDIIPDIDRQDHDYHHMSGHNPAIPDIQIPSKDLPEMLQIIESVEKKIENVAKYSYQDQYSYDSKNLYGSHSGVRHGGQEETVVVDVHHSVIGKQEYGSRGSGSRQIKPPVSVKPASVHVEGHTSVHYKQQSLTSKVTQEGQTIISERYESQTGIKGTSGTNSQYPRDNSQYPRDDSQPVHGQYPRDSTSILHPNASPPPDVVTASICTPPPHPPPVTPVATRDPKQVQAAFMAAMKGDKLNLKRFLDELGPGELGRIREAGTGNTLAHPCAEKGRLDCLQMLYAHLPQLLRERNKAKLTPAALGIKAGQIEVVDWLLDKVLSPSDLLARGDKRPLLHQAAKYGQDGCLRLLLSKMSQYYDVTDHINVSDFHGNTPAHLAAKHGNLTCLQTLVEYGLDSSRANKFGHTACYYADFSNHRHCAGYLAMVDTCLLLAKQLVLTAQAQQGSYGAGPDMLQSIKPGVRPGQTYGIHSETDLRKAAWKIIRGCLKEITQQLLVCRTQVRNPYIRSQSFCGGSPVTSRHKEDKSLPEPRETRSMAGSIRGVKSQRKDEASNRKRRKPRTDPLYLERHDGTLINVHHVINDIITEMGTTSINGDPIKDSYVDLHTKTPDTMSKSELHLTRAPSYTTSLSPRARLDAPPPPPPPTSQKMLVPDTDHHHPRTPLVNSHVSTILPVNGESESPATSDDYIVPSPPATLNKPSATDQNAFSRTADKPDEKDTEAEAINQSKLDSEITKYEKVLKYIMDVNKNHLHQDDSKVCVPREGVTYTPPSQEASLTDVPEPPSTPLSVHSASAMCMRNRRHELHARIMRLNLSEEDSARLMKSLTASDIYNGGNVPIKLRLSDDDFKETYLRPILSNTSNGQASPALSHVSSLRGDHRAGMTGTGGSGARRSKSTVSSVRFAMDQQQEGSVGRAATAPSEASISRGGSQHSTIRSNASSFDRLSLPAMSSEGGDLLQEIMKEGDFGKTTTQARPWYDVSDEDDGGFAGGNKKSVSHSSRSSSLRETSDV